MLHGNDAERNRLAPRTLIPVPRTRSSFFVIFRHGSHDCGRSRYPFQNVSVWVVLARSATSERPARVAPSRSCFVPSALRGASR